MGRDRKAYFKRYYQDHKAELTEYKRQWLIGHPLFSVWRGMKARCFNSKVVSYKTYGARGITICDAWLDYETFEKWGLANGYQEGLSIDRIDNNDNYEPSNCQFITKSENSQKKKGDGK